MFKLESYITPILLSYVDKYINNFRPQDSQVSLWGGDASFHNLDLRLEVLEQELQLPFTFISGHIHELLIHVPWTKLASEPITITINTIECVLKLRNEQSNTASPVETSRENRKKSPRQKQEIVAPPGYVQSLVNKIVSNISINCNNLILKYVEEDIVVSMNIKLLTFQSANQKWEPAFTDFTAGQVMLRKVINVTDLTVCVDKRNASGKIDVYQEPVLYRCSMEMHLFRSYHTATSKKISVTRLDIYCHSMEFSMTEQQIPMLMRIIMLLLALHGKQIKKRANSTCREELDNDDEESEEALSSWVGWAWSFVPSILPMSSDDEWTKEYEQKFSGHTIQMGFYVDNATLTFKITEGSSDHNYYTPRKLKYLPLLKLELKECFLDTIIHGSSWTNVQFGVSYLLLIPQGYCTCGVSEILDNAETSFYIKSGNVNDGLHKKKSLFDVNFDENDSLKRMYNISWDYHLATATEAILLEKSPGFAVDYLYQLELPDDFNSEKLSEIGSDLEYSNLSERAICRVVLGSLLLKIGSGLIHRISTLRQAAAMYDYPPYVTVSPDPPLSELQPPSEDDFDALSSNIPVRIYQLTSFKPRIEFLLLDHPYFEATKRNLFKKRKISTTLFSKNNTSFSVPKFTAECQCLDAKIVYPMYPNRLVITTCQLPDPPSEMFNACYKRLQVKVLGAFSQMIGSEKKIKFLMPTNISYNSKTILKPHYWINPDVLHYERVISFDTVTLTVTKAKLLVIIYILKSFVSTEEASLIYNSTLLNDAFAETAMPHLELCIEDIKWHHIRTVSTVSFNIHLGGIKGFIIEMQQLCKSDSSHYNKSKCNYPHKAADELRKSFLKEPQQVMVLSGPEHCSKEQDVEMHPLCTCIIQYSIDAVNQFHPPVIVLNVAETKLCFDPLFSSWIRYQPDSIQKSDFNIMEPEVRRNRSLSEINNSLAESSRRTVHPQESVHGSSDKDQILTYHSVASVISKDNEDAALNPLDNSFNTAVSVSRWYFLWGSVLLHVNILKCTIIFPTKSLYAVGVQSLQEALDVMYEKENNLEVIVMSLPQICLQNGTSQRNFQSYLNQMPIKVPESIWTQDKISFPLTLSINDMGCYTVQNKISYCLLKSTSCNAIIAISSKQNESVEKNKSDEKYNSGFNKKTTQTNVKIDLKLSKQVDISSRVCITPLNSLAICIHMDMTPLTISISEEQISLIAKTLFVILDIFSVMFPGSQKSNYIEPPQKIAMPMFEDSSPTVSQAARDNATDFVSQYTSTKLDPTDASKDNDFKMSAWFQWTVARIKINFFTNDMKSKHTYSSNHVHRLKMVLDAEDFITSVDLQNIYMKIKSKVSSASVKHYTRSSHDGSWSLGPFSGLIMQGRDDIIASSQSREDQGGFVNITLTRARCGHVHDKWQASFVQKSKGLKAQLYSTETKNSDRYLCEVVVAIQPTDFILSLDTLCSFMTLLEPLAIFFNSATDIDTSVSNSSSLNTNSLPLLYLDCREIRIILPTTEVPTKKLVHDVYILQVSNINIKPIAENPIGRAQLRPDIYQQAAQLGILYIPGSTIEDRQYQINILSVSMSTGFWKELYSFLNFEGTATSNLHTMNENPALEWNNLGRKLGVMPSLDLLYIINRFDLCVLIAPAIVYNNNIVCGHAIEVNCVSDAEFSVCLSQIALVSSLVVECLNFSQNVSRFFNDSKGINVLPRIHKEKDDYVILKNCRDSGIEMNDLSTDTIDSKNLFGTNAIAETSSSNQLSVMSETSMKTAMTFVPFDFFVTGRSVSITLYKFGLTKFKDLSHDSSSEDFDYEASEEGSQEEPITNNKRAQGLIFISFSQPNTFYSKSVTEYKIKMSLYDLKVKASKDECKTVKDIPIESDFNINLLETKPGEPDVNTGILPAFLTVQFLKDITKHENISIDISRPTKLNCSLNRLTHLFNIKAEILESLKHLLDYIVASSKQTEIQRINPKGDKNQVYTKFRLIKEKLGNVSSVHICISQFVLSLISKFGSEMNFNSGKLNGHMSVIKRPERVTCSVSFESITIGVCHNGKARMLLNPWNCNFNLCLFWESWQNVNSDPQVQISAESDCVMIDVGPDHLKCINFVVNEYKEIVDNFNSGSEPEYIGPKDEISRQLEKEQHYKDDLRAGAFQFVEFNNDVTDELPLPYQVVFTKQPEPSMAWRYPQPRVLTKMRVFPVPFKMLEEKSEDESPKALCRLDYWSECRGDYIPHIHFQLSESEMCQLNLPTTQPQSAVACVWRVVILSPSLRHFDYEQTRDIISPQALAACIRIDSYYNPTLVPKIQFSFKISAINLSLYNHIDKRYGFEMPPPLKMYKSDNLVPESQWFLTVSLELIRTYVALWNRQQVVFEIEGSVRSDILDYRFLSKQPLIEPFSGKFSLSLSNNLSIKLMTEPIDIKFGPCTAHTLGISSQIWNIERSSSKNLIIMTCYVICNETNIPVCFGQADSDETILLHSGFSHLYSWHSQKYKRLIRMSVEDKKWIWSKPFGIDIDGNFMCRVNQESGLIIVHVKSLSATQKQIIFSGQLTIYNMLQEKFEIKILPLECENKETVFKNTCSYRVAGKSYCPSFVTSTDKKISLRIRYFGLESAWSGDIPLVENPKCHQPWLVKVPLKDRGQYLSIWCRIVIENNSVGKRILAMFWPLFMLRSNFPTNVDVCMQTPTLNITLETNVEGQGVIQQLYCPGTTDHSHQLTFLFKGGNISPNQYIPLNYSLINQKEFFKKPDVDSIDEIINSLQDFSNPSWPYVNSGNIVWNTGNQPVTDIQVSYQKFHKYSSTLLLEISPWCLILNTLGCTIAIIVEEKEKFRVAHNMAFAPRKLEGTFNIGVGLKKKWHMSYPLRLSTTSNTSFYMPKIIGLIPNKGLMKVPIRCDDHLCMVIMSNEKHNDMKIINIYSTHAIANYTSYTLSVFCLAVLTDIDSDSISSECIFKNSLMISPTSNEESRGIPILQWYILEDSSTVASNVSLYMIVFFDNKYGYSCPVRIDHPLLRYSIAVPVGNTTIPIIINAQERANQMFISLHDDKYPQLFIENNCNLPITCNESKLESDSSACTTLFNWMLTINPTCTAHYTMPNINEKFPEIAQNYQIPKLLIGVKGRGGRTQWSPGINICESNEQYVRIPTICDLKVVVEAHCHTTFVFVDSISHVEISAGDIRNRLQFHEDMSKDQSYSDQDKKEFGHDLPNLEVSNFSALPKSKSGEFNLSYKQFIKIKNATKNVHFDHNSDVSTRAMKSEILEQTELIKSPQEHFSFSLVDISIFVKSLMVTLTDNCLFENTSVSEKAIKTEVATLTCDHILFTLTQSENIDILCSVSDLQIDNQLYNQGGYDFPVVLISQEPCQDLNFPFSLSFPLEQIVATTINNPLIEIRFNMELWKDRKNQRITKELSSIKVTLKPFQAFVEDTFFMTLSDYSSKFIPSKLYFCSNCTEMNQTSSLYVTFPREVLLEAQVLAKPFILHNLEVEPLSLMLSVHSSRKVYIALDHSPLYFNTFTRQNLVTTPYRLGHALTVHYLSETIFGAGWLIGSLEILGSPSGLALSLGSGIHDFVNMPYQGFLQGPWGFLVGITQGSASLLTHITAGTLNSVSKLAASVARNIDRITFDEEHLRRTEQLRRQRPQGLAQGLTQGLTGLGISLLGAVGGLAHHPLQSLVTEGASASSLALGIGRGIVGAFTKPLSGAAELLALTGQGLLHDTGWDLPPTPRRPVGLDFVQSQHFSWKLIQNTIGVDNKIVFVMDATLLAYGTYESVTLVLTSDALIIINMDEDTSFRIISLSEFREIEQSSDPTVLYLYFVKARDDDTDDDTDNIEMDPETRARVTDYIRNSTSLVDIPSSSQSQLETLNFNVPAPPNDGQESIQPSLVFNVNPQFRNYFLSLLALIKRQNRGKGFPVL